MEEKKLVQKAQKKTLVQPAWKKNIRINIIKLNSTNFMPSLV